MKIQIFGTQVILLSGAISILIHVATDHHDPWNEYLIAERILDEQNRYYDSCPPGATLNLELIKARISKAEERMLKLRKPLLGN